MLTTKRVEVLIAFILTLGTLLAILFVLLGGLFYLFQYGNNTFQSELLDANIYQLDIKKLLSLSFSASAIGLIELGLLVLVATQLLRVALLAWFYFMTRDYQFTLISTFILLMLIYSFVWQR